MSDQLSHKQKVAARTSIGAAVLFVTVGILQVLQGIAAVGGDELFVVGADYTYEFDLTVWGWTHLVLGVVVAMVGVALLAGGIWARTLAVVVAGLSIVVNFLWLPYQPGWAGVIIAIDAVVIWAIWTWVPSSGWE
ncbi:DUF7144 family membrane protein [Rhodococcus kronopolitis]|uniref:DUF7144 domain-containing protein n=1 Tax=Rhodococcus kronopolitis TaxID=1460226 RepID=A0ABV9FL81_9NOCA